MNIDWSKAPEWATHHGYAGIGMCEVWLNDCQYTYVDGKQGGRVFSFAAKKGWEVDEIINVSPRPGMPKWTGEGLPPAGTTCEVWHVCHPNDIQVRTILFVGRSIVVMSDPIRAEVTGRLEKTQFRPLRTPEQIAAEERERGIQNILNHFPFEPCTERKLAETLYDAGYRLVEGGAQ